MNTNELFNLMGAVTVRKNYAGDITIPNVPGIDDIGGHDDWKTTFYFSCEEDLNNLIAQGKSPWFGNFKFPFAINKEESCVSFSYTGAQAYDIAQYIVSRRIDGHACGMDSLISWLCNIINPILDHIEACSGKVVVISE